MSGVMKDLTLYIVSIIYVPTILMQTYSRIYIARYNNINFMLLDLAHTKKKLKTTKTPFLFLKKLTENLSLQNLAYKRFIKTN